MEKIVVTAGDLMKKSEQAGQAASACLVAAGAVEIVWSDLWYLSASLCTLAVFGIWEAVKLSQRADRALENNP